MSDVRVEETHSLPPEEAKKCVADFEEMMQKYGVSATWSGLRAKLKGTGVTGTIHYRLAPDQMGAAAQLEPVARAAAERHGLRPTLGRMIFEVRPALAVNKGTAIRDLAQDLDRRGIVFFGDDLTDVDAFRAVRELREVGEAATLRVGVLGPDTSPAVLAEIDMSVDGVPACAATLIALAARLSEETEGA